MTRETWLRRAGQDDALAWPAAGTSEDGRLSCDGAGCLYRAAGQVVAIVREPSALAEDCRLAGVVVALIPVRRACHSATMVIDRFALWREGGHAIWLEADGRARVDLAVFGVALGAMNLCFYLAIARLPLGTAVAIEFSGPITVAALGSRRPRDLAAVGLAAAGVVLLADVQWAGNAAGVGFALASAALWAGYIVWGRRVGSFGAAAGLDGLALSTAAGALVVAPAGIAGLVSHGPADGSLVVAVAACAVVALCSNVVPYALDQVVLARVAAPRLDRKSTRLNSSH